MTHHLFPILALVAIIAVAGAQGNQCTANTFQITGNGKVSVAPDIVQLTISATGNAPTASNALSKLNAQINSILKAFTTLNIPTANYSTSGININQVFNYSNDPITISGSEATQSLRVTLGGTKTLTSLLQALSNVDVTIQNMIFDVYDRTSALQKARAAAFADAKNKFSQYLSLTSLSNDGLKKISDLKSEVYTPYQTDANNYALLSRLRANPNPVEVQASVSATWRIKS